MDFKIIILTYCSNIVIIFNVFHNWIAVSRYLFLVFFYELQVEMTMILKIEYICLCTLCLIHD